MTLPTPDIHEMKFQKAKRYRRLKMKNYSQGTMRCLVDIDDTNTLIVTIYPSTTSPEDEGKL